MTSVVLDRYNGVNAGQAIKVPVKATSTGALTLSGEQTIDGVACVEGDRVLYRHGTTTNGIYIVSTGAWTRATDWDGVFDVVKGTLTYVSQGSNAGTVFVVSTSDPIVIDTTSVAFTATNFATILAASETVQGIIEIATQAETNTGTDDLRAITPLKLTTLIAARLATESLTGIAELATQTETNTGTDDARIVTPLKLASDPVLDAYGMSNGIITWSIAANALTVALKTKAGTDPSATDPVYVRFRSATITDGGYVIRKITAALSLVITAGSTLGTTSAIPSRIRAMLIDNAGAVKMGVYNATFAVAPVYSIRPIDDNTLQTTVAEGGAGGADNYSTIYSDAAYISKAVLEVGYMESTQTTAGTWAQAIEKMVTKNGHHYRQAGDIISSIMTNNYANSTTATAIPGDNTIPQITEGAEVMNRTIDVTNKCNMLRIRANAFVSPVGATATVAALFRDAIANAKCASVLTLPADYFGVQCLVWQEPALTSGITTYTVRIGNVTATNVGFGKQGSGGFFFANTHASFMQVEEIFS